LRPDGTILDKPGYDRATGLIYHPAPGLAVPSIPERPTDDDLRLARALLWEAIGEFPYDGDASRANALGLLLTAVVRPAIPGPVPLALLDAPQAGTGKSLLAEVVARIATGRPAAMMGAPSNDEECRKQITATLMLGGALVVIDNVEHPLEAPSLARALTAETWTDRYLGRSRMLTLPQRATWIATGNNLRLRGDLPRRSYWVRLDAKLARAWQRHEFTHPDLPGWVTEQRGELLAALLTLARAWYAAGRPSVTVPVVGGFTGWARTVGGILAHAGVTGFLSNLDHMYEASDEEAGQWEGFLRAWRERYRDAAITTAGLVEALRARPDMQADRLQTAVPDVVAELLDGPPSALPRRLGKALARRVDVRHGDDNIRLAKAHVDHGVQRWRVCADPPA
jgi:hypothetical protein